MEQGLEPGDRVAIVSSRSTLAVIAILAALRARAAYVPIDPSVPQARLDHVLRDSGARVLLVGEGAEPATTCAWASAVLSIAEGIRAGPGRTLDRPGPDLDDLAYLMYTSGSTGRPKGVLIEHGGLADYLSWASRQYVRGDRLTFPLFTSMAVRPHRHQPVPAPDHGGHPRDLPGARRAGRHRAHGRGRANAVDFIKLTPSHLSLLATDRSRGLPDSPHGGRRRESQEPLAAAISAQLHDQVELHNEYGPTEAVVGCVAHRYDPEADTEASVPIGVPADHVRSRS